MNRARAAAGMPPVDDDGGIALVIEVQRIRLEPGEVLVIYVSSSVTIELAERLKALMEAAFPHNLIAVLPSQFVERMEAVTAPSAEPRRPEDVHELRGHPGEIGTTFEGQGACTHEGANPRTVATRCPRCHRRLVRHSTAEPWRLDP